MLGVTFVLCQKSMKISWHPYQFQIYLLYLVGGCHLSKNGVYPSFMTILYWTMWMRNTLGVFTFFSQIFQPSRCPTFGAAWFPIVPKALRKRFAASPLRRNSEPPWRCATWRSKWRRRRLRWDSGSEGTVNDEEVPRKSLLLYGFIKNQRFFRPFISREFINSFLAPARQVQKSKYESKGDPIQ